MWGQEGRSEPRLPPTVTLYFLGLLANRRTITPEDGELWEVGLNQTGSWAPEK